MFIGFCAAFIDSIAGGGGLLMVPALLTAGIPPHLTLGTNKLAATMGVAMAVKTYLAKGFFNLKLWWSAAIAAFFGAMLGAVSIYFISAQFLQLLLPAIVILVAVYALWPKRIEDYQHNQHYRPKQTVSGLMGAIIGFYDGFLGPGTGSFWTTGVMFFFKMDILAASAVARFMNFVSNIVALATFCILGNVDYKLGLSIGVAMMLGSFCGAQAAVRYGAKFIRPIFVTVVIILALRLIYLEWI